MSAVDELYDEIEEIELPERIYPAEPLIEAAGTRDAAITVMRVSGSTMRRLLERGLTERQADRYAARVGRHPWELWPDWLARSVA